MPVTIETLLQWGHVSIDVEVRVTKTYPYRGPMLQWGHVSIDVEVALADAQAALTAAASMGPRLHRRGSWRGRS